MHEEQRYALIESANQLGGSVRRKTNAVPHARSCVTRDDRTKDEKEHEPADVVIELNGYVNLDTVHEACEVSSHLDRVPIG